MSDKEKTGFSFKNVLAASLIIILISIYIFFALTISGSGNVLSKYFKGSDFKNLYNKTLLIKNHDSQKIYKLDSYKKILEKKTAAEKIEVLYPPVFYYFYLPFTLLPYYYGVLSITLFYIFLYIASIILLILTFKRLYKHSLIIILFSVLFPPFIFVIFNGHPSVLWIFILSLAFYLAKKNNPFFAGIVLSFLLLKPGLFIIVFIILLFSFRMKTFSGLFLGALLLFIVTGLFDNFNLWGSWLDIIKYLSKDIFKKETLSLFGNFSERMFFYPMNATIKLLNIIEYAFVITGLFAIFFPIIYSYNQKKTFSRNSYWFILTISLVLANPYLYNYDLVILILPIIIFFNLMLADRVITKYIFLMLAIVITGIALCFVVSIFFQIQIFAVILWFFLINGAMGKRIRNFTPNNFIDYWDNY